MKEPSMTNKHVTDDDSYKSRGYSHCSQRPPFFHFTRQLL